MRPSSKLQGFSLLSGVSLTLLIVALIFFTGKLLPQKEEDLLPGNPNVLSVVSTIFLFALLLVRLWYLRRRDSVLFWTVFCSAFLLHLGGVFVYSANFHPLRSQDWMILAALEIFALGFGLSWLMDRFAHSE